MDEIIQRHSTCGPTTCAWGTRLQDPAHPYESACYLENLKQRDFSSVPIEVTCGPDLRMHIVGDPSTNPTRLQTRRGNPGNKDGMDQAAEAWRTKVLSTRRCVLCEELGGRELTAEWVPSRGVRTESFERAGSSDRQALDRIMTTGRAQDFR
jgi:hypothetical protein